MRRMTIPGVLVLLLGLLSACTPPDKPLLALSVQQGRPVGVLVTCGDGLAQVSVYERTTGTPGAWSFVRWHVSGAPPSEIVEVPLLGEPPAGWRLDDTRETPAPEAGETTRYEQLTALEPGVGYALGGSTGVDDAVSITFTIADLDRLGPDEVLTAVERDEPRIVSRDTFVDDARDSCD
ncbi:hypothetical protein AB0L86_30990 [Micromonospora musae]|uniref:hypothetical protein n=1 Tax=Micromonospora musae TaxID=1894970 RepID=UPI00344392C0